MADKTINSCGANTLSCNTSARLEENETDRKCQIMELLEDDINLDRFYDQLQDTNWCNAAKVKVLFIKILTSCS